MIEQQARVLRADERLVSVRIGGQSGCTACDAGKGCGAGLFGRLLRRKPVEIELPNEVGAVAGQPVQLGLPESLFMKMVLRLYGWPLLAGLLGAACGHWLAANARWGAGLTDLLALTGAVLGAGMVLKFWNRTTRNDVSSGDICLLETPGDELADRQCPGK